MRANSNPLSGVFQKNTTDSKSVELRFMSVRVGLGVPFIKKINTFVSKELPP